MTTLAKRKAQAIGPSARLLNIDRNAKTVKGQKKGYLTGILYLAPAKLSGWEVCPMRSAGCTTACLNTAGRGGMSNVQQSRIRRTRWFFEDRQDFLAQLIKEIAGLVRQARREGLTPAVRLNGTSDVPWERVKVGLALASRLDRKDRRRLASVIPGLPAEGENTGDPTLFDLFPQVQFYDYTKITKRAAAWAHGDMPANYHVTLSATEENAGSVWYVASLGGNIAMVFHPRLPDQWGGMTVIDGDESDVRFDDPDNVIVGLTAKGEAKRDTSGFVRHI